MLIVHALFGLVILSLFLAMMSDLPEAGGKGIAPKAGSSQRNR